MKLQSYIKITWRLLILVFLLALNGSAFSARWIELNAIGLNQPQSSFPHWRTGSIVFNLNDSIYYGSGFYDGMIGPRPNNDFHKLEITNNLWSDAGSVPFDMNSLATNFQSFSISGKGYYCDEFNHTWEFNPTIFSWTQKADYPGLARSRSICFSSNNNTPDSFKRPKFHN